MLEVFIWNKKKEHLAKWLKYMGEKKALVSTDARKITGYIASDLIRYDASSWRSIETDKSIESVLYKHLAHCKTWCPFEEWRWVLLYKTTWNFTITYIKWFRSTSAKCQHFSSFIFKLLFIHLNCFINIITTKWDSYKFYSLLKSDMK